jgi:hypothetical protein
LADSYRNGGIMLGYTIDDLDKMSNAVHNSYKYITDPTDKEGILMAQSFLQGLWAEGYFD